MNKKLLTYLFLMLPMLLMTSCLKDQEDVFADSATARTTKYLENAKKVLTSSEYGWVLNYFPDREQSYGGYSYTLKFDDENVTVTTELANDKTQTLTTSYILNNEDGPVLMFDTYNDYLHLFATPHGSSGAGGYEAYDGDFIFIIMNISEDQNTITLKGNRSGNIMYMHRLTEGIVDYQLELAEFVNNLVFDQAVAQIDGKTYLLNIAADDRYVTIEAQPEDAGDEEAEEETEEEEPIEAPFCFDKDGFSLYEPITIGGKEVRVFKYDENEGTFTAQEDNSVVFIALLTPSIVTNNIGENISIGNGAVTLNYSFNLADKFTYTSDSDWITVTVNGNNVTIQVAANTTGASRSGQITVTTELGSATITVTQLPLHEIFLNSEAYVAYSNISAAARPYFDACRALSDSEGETISEMSFVNIGDPYGYGIWFVSGNYAGLMALDVETVADKEIKFAYASARNYSNGSWYYNYGYYELIDYLESTTFKISADNEDNPSYFVLTDSKDDTKYFKLTIAPVANPFNN
ncbi:MAG: DUF4302 domain-containing protein [Prevotella sp.]|nr:DUF4302 domain-containing protein [Prevotella sp.]